MEEIGFRASKAFPCVYFHDAWDVQAVTHVDDFLIVGQEKHLKKINQSISQRYEIKHQILGPDATDVQEATFLGRRIAWTSRGISYEADPKHAQALIAEWGMETCRPVSSPGVAHEDKKTKEHLSELEKKVLGPAEAKKYRGGAARFNYLAMDRMDVAFAAKELSRTMSAPTEAE